MRMDGVIAGYLCSLALPAFAGETRANILPNSPQVFQGGIVEIKVAGEETREAKGFLREQKISFFPESGLFKALIGVDLEEKPGPSVLAVQVWDKNGGRREESIVLQVREKKFLQEKITVPAAFDRIDELTRKRIEREQGQLARLWAISTARRLWEGGFLVPVSGGITAPFGLRRIVNGLARSPHGGVDMRASLGTEVFAANHGRVVLREEFFFSGKSVVLDHGGGLYTMYFHLADFRVDHDSHLRKGDVIGLVGRTGRVTGPHLHWGARLNGSRVDPFELIDKGQ